MKKNKKITGKMAIGDVLRDFPATAPVFLKYGLHCAGCPMSEPETISEAARLHQIEAQEFLKELNEVTEQN
jgi:hybrid cluster-associated redox disulfide protein